jgi:hypothetical protein
VAPKQSRVRSLHSPPPPHSRSEGSGGRKASYADKLRLLVSVDSSDDDDSTRGSALPSLRADESSDASADDASPTLAFASLRAGVSTKLKIDGAKSKVHSGASTADPKRREKPHPPPQRSSPRAAEPSARSPRATRSPVLAADVGDAAAVPNAAAVSPNAEAVLPDAAACSPHSASPSPNAGEVVAAEVAARGGEDVPPPPDLDAEENSSTSATDGRVQSNADDSLRFASPQSSIEVASIDCFDSLRFASSEQSRDDLDLVKSNPATNSPPPSNAPAGCPPDES